MDLKKNKDIDPNRVRSTFLLIGFNLIMGLLLAAFSYEKKVKVESRVTKVENEKENKFVNKEDPEEPPEKPPPPPEEPPPPPPPPTTVDITDSLISKENDTTEVILTQAFELGEEEVKVEEIKIEEVIDFPDVEPSFEGGEEAMQIWMQQNLKYPEISMEMGDQGRVFLTFVVEKDGRITDVKVLKGVSKELDKEAIRLVRGMQKSRGGPGFNPGEQNGLKVRSPLTLPINFELN